MTSQYVRTFNKVDAHSGFKRTLMAGKGKLAAKRMISMGSILMFVRDEIYMIGRLRSFLLLTKLASKLYSLYKIYCYKFCGSGNN